MAHLFSPSLQVRSGFSERFPADQCILTILYVPGQASCRSYSSTHDDDGHIHADARSTWYITRDFYCGCVKIEQARSRVHNLIYRILRTHSQIPDLANT